MNVEINLLGILQLLVILTDVVHHSINARGAANFFKLRTGVREGIWSLFLLLFLAVLKVLVTQNVQTKIRVLVNPSFGDIFALVQVESIKNGMVDIKDGSRTNLVDGVVNFV